MKTGRPHMKIPSPQTVSRDVHVIFKNVRARIAELLKVSLEFVENMNKYSHCYRTTMGA